MESVLVNDTQETNQHSVRHVYSDSNITQSMTQTTSSIPNGNDHQEYEKQAEEMLEDIWKLYNGNESWTDEVKSRDGLDIVTSKNFPKWGKVFRLIVRRFKGKWRERDFSRFLLEHNHWNTCKHRGDVIRTTRRYSQMESISKRMQSR